MQATTHLGVWLHGVLSGICLSIAVVSFMRKIEEAEELEGMEIPPDSAGVDPVLKAPDTTGLQFSGVFTRLWYKYTLWLMRRLERLSEGAENETVRRDR